MNEFSTEYTLDILDTIDEDLIKFVLDDYTVGRMTQLLALHQYDKLLFEYGILPYLGILNFFIEQEFYKRCKLMVDVIIKYNQSLNTSLPMSLEDERVNKWRSMSPHEFLNNKL